MSSPQMQPPAVLLLCRQLAGPPKPSSAASSTVGLWNANAGHEPWSSHLYRSDESLREVTTKPEYIDTQYSGE